MLACAAASCALHSFTESKPQPPAPTSGYVTVDKLPFREAWYGTYLNEEKIGYSHFKIEPANQNFTFTNDSLMRFTRLKKVEEVKQKERVVIRPDLTMVSFEYTVRKNDKDMRMIGRSDGENFVVEATVDGQTLSRKYPLREKVYHSSAIGLMPALRGLKEGQAYAFDVFSEGKLEIEKIDQRISSVKGPAGPNGAVWRVSTNVGPSVVQSWLDMKGLTVLERGRESSLIVMLEDEKEAQKFLDQKTPAKDLVLDVSLIRVSKPLPNAEKLQFLKARFQGIEQSLIPEDHRQKVTTPSDSGSKDAFDVTVRTEDLSRFQKPAEKPVGPSFEPYLASTMKIQSDHKEIVDQAKKIVSPDDPALEKVKKLTHWTVENIKSEVKDSFTALAVLHSKEGECKSHAALYTALARSQGIPTRVVTGIVYSNHGGFLYHAWCESYVNGWLAVDPTLNQFPADATHIKIAAGDSEESASAVSQMLGKVKLEVLEYR